MSTHFSNFSELEYEGWERVAHKYENAWSGLTRLFIPHLLQAAQVKPGTRLLDVACGPGYVAEAALSLGARPIGVDFSEAMIRLAQEGSPEIEFFKGDAQLLDFEADRFDVVAMNFGLLHLSHPEAAFAEAARVLRSGGQYGFTVWAGPEDSPGARIVEEAVKAHADMKVKLPAGPDYFGYSNADMCREILAGLGFDSASLEFKTVTVEWQVPSPSFIFESERDAGVRTAALLAAQTAETLLAIRKEIEKAIRVYKQGDGFAIPYAAHVVSITAT